MFLDGIRWDARYVPAMRQRGPFISAADGGDLLADAASPLMHIDMNDPRVGAADGEPLFLRHGGDAPYLQHMANVLAVISQGHRMMGPALNGLAEAGLLHPTSINIELGDGQTILVEDVHVVTRESLASLSAHALERLSKNGLLYIAHMAAASLENMNHLIARHQKKHGSTS